MPLRRQELAQALRAVQAGRRYVQPAVAAILESAPDDDAPTPRELATLRLVAEGRRNAEIAATLRIKERTVRFHLDNLFRKCGVASRTELIRAAQERGWLAPQGPR